MVINFAAGPAKLPRPVLEQVQRELLDYAGSGISVMELSHRSAEFEALLRRAESRVRDLLYVVRPASGPRHAAPRSDGGGRIRT